MMFSPSLILYKTSAGDGVRGVPWRWLSPLSVAGTLLVASAVAQARKKWMATAVRGSRCGLGRRRDRLHRNWEARIIWKGWSPIRIRQTGYPIRFGDWSNPVGSQLSRLDKAAPLVASR